MIRRAFGGRVPICLVCVISVSACAPQLLSTTTGQSSAVLQIGQAGFFETGLRHLLLHHGANGLLISMVVLLATCFLRMVRALRRLNQTFESRIADREKSLEEHYARLAAHERQKAAADERTRIMRDLHDGLGSRLVTTLSRAERGAMDLSQMATSLRACIADLRLALDALAPDVPDLCDTFDDFLFRWQHEFDAVAVQCVWHMDIAADQVRLSPHDTLHLLRIAQEALTNVAKHARATQVDLSLRCRDGSLRLMICDNGVGVGVGVTTAPSYAGRGLHNMRSRSVQLGGSLVIEAGPDQGTSVVLTLACPSARLS